MNENSTWAPDSCAARENLRFVKFTYLIDTADVAPGTEILDEKKNRKRICIGRRPIIAYTIYNQPNYHAYASCRASAYARINAISLIQLKYAEALRVSRILITNFTDLPSRN